MNVRVTWENRCMDTEREEAEKALSRVEAIFGRLAFVPDHSVWADIETVRAALDAGYRKQEPVHAIADDGVRCGAPIPVGTKGAHIETNVTCPDCKQARNA